MENYYYNSVYYFIPSIGVCLMMAWLIDAPYSIDVRQKQT